MRWSKHDYETEQHSFLFTKTVNETEYKIKGSAWRENGAIETDITTVPVMWTEDEDGIENAVKEHLKTIEELN